MLKRPSIILISMVYFLFPGISLLFPQTDLIGRNSILNLRWGTINDGWNNIFEFRDVKVNKGPFGRLDIILSDNSFAKDENTELLLHFDKCEKDRIIINSSNYSIEKVNIYPSKQIKKIGNGSCAFLHYNNFIKLKPINESIFLERESVNSFIIELFVFPSLVLDGSTILSYYAPLVELDGEFCGLRAFFENGILKWEFKNLFGDKNNNFVDITIKENVPTPVNEWHHHAIYYNSKNGLLTLFYDGKISGLKWLTKSGYQDSTLLKGRFSRTLNVPLIIGKNFLGYIDEFRIKRVVKEVMPTYRTFEKKLFDLGEYKESGEIESNVIDLGSKGIKLIKAFWESIEENGTAIRVYYRCSNIYFQEKNEKIEWIQLKNNIVNETISKGRFFQWKAKLYGTEGKYTPYLLSLNIEFETDPFPQVPYLIRAVPLHKGVRLLWIKNKENDIKGYKVYYGTSSKYYFGKNSKIGDSPVFVGNVDNVEIKNLVNDTVYYFCITAIDNSDQESGFSKEFIVRPSSVYGN